MLTTSDSKKEYKIISRHGIADVGFDTITNHHSLYSTVAFEPGDIIIKFCAASTQNYATYLTVQTSSDTHITLEPLFLQFINHSCNPNVFFDTTAMQLVCVRSVEPGDELVFFYPSAEWKMAQPFICSCGSNNCLQFINGAKHLSNETLKNYRLTDFILQQIKKNFS